MPGGLESVEGPGFSFRFGEMRDLAIIAALSERTGAIGISGGLPWNFPQDLKFFRRITWGHAVIMGRRTLESLPKVPLPGRRNIVVSRTLSPEGVPRGVEVYSSFEGAISAGWETDLCPFVIGGASLYRRALPLATVMYLTFVEGDFRGDVYFPSVDRADWEVSTLYYLPPLRYTVWTRKGRATGGR